MAAPAAPPAKRGGNRLLMIGIVVVFLIAVLGGGGYFANASLSSQYSPQRAVTDYFAAQARGDVAGMMSNATFLKGNGGLDQFFNQAAVTAMMAVPENKAISDVKVTSTQQLDSSTSTVSVSLSWAASPVTFDFKVHRDTTRAHYVFYNSWLVDIPAASISITLPNQAGALSVDGIALPSGSGTSVQVIQGYHSVTMASTDLYDSATFKANATQGSANVTIPSKLGTAAQAAAVDAIKKTFGDCDPSVYIDCLDHTYAVPSAGCFNFAGVLPGGSGIITCHGWVFTFTSDPTADMQTTVERDTGKVSAQGSCAVTLTVDGSKTYKFSGAWAAELDWSGGAFNTILTYDCLAAAA